MLCALRVSLTQVLTMELKVRIGMCVPQDNTASELKAPWGPQTTLTGKSWQQVESCHLKESIPVNKEDLQGKERRGRCLWTSCTYSIRRSKIVLVAWWSLNPLPGNRAEAWNSEARLQQRVMERNPPTLAWGAGRMDYKLLWQPCWE